MAITSADMAAFRSQDSDSFIQLKQQGVFAVIFSDFCDASSKFTHEVHPDPGSHFFEQHYYYSFIYFIKHVKKQEHDSNKSFL